MHAFDYSSLQTYNFKFSVEQNKDYIEILRRIDIIDEFLHGWCSYLQAELGFVLPGSKAYKIWEITPETKQMGDGFFNDHQVVKWRGKYIDVRGIFDSEEELIDAYKIELIRCNKFFTPKYYKSVITTYLGRTSFEERVVDDSLPSVLSRFIASVIINDPVIKSMV